MKSKTLLFVFASAALLGTMSCGKEQGPVREAVSHKDTYQQAYVYGFPMIAAYKAMYQFNVDKTNSQYKGPFNQVLSTAQVFKRPAGGQRCKYDIAGTDQSADSIRHLDAVRGHSLERRRVEIQCNDAVAATHTNVATHRLTHHSKADESNDWFVRLRAHFVSR